MTEEKKFEDQQVEVNQIEKEEIDSHLDLSKLDTIEEDGVNIHCINSSEFVVGRQTNFNGPVTIINCLNDSFSLKSLPKNHEVEKIVIKDKILTESATATMEEYAKKKLDENILKSAVDTKKKIWWLFRKNLFKTSNCIWIFLGIILGIVICFSIVFSKPFLNSKYDKEENNLMCLSYNSTINEFCFYSDFDGNGWHSLNKIHLQRPFKNVVISHTDAESCFHFHSCISIVESINKYDINNISYCHFYVGGDGNFYESLSKHLTENSTISESLNICLIGSFSKNNYPTYPQIKAVKNFLHFGVENNLLTNDYMIVPASSIIHLDTESSLYKIIKKWPNFKSGVISVEDITHKNTIANFKIYHKNDWNGLPANSFVEMKLPVPYVVISHSVTPKCFSLISCSPILKNMQNYHFSKNLADILYNFLVDSNGNIYEGRGWKYRNAHINFVNGRNIGINFIGDYSTDITPTKYQFDGVKQLIQYGTENGKISQNYSLIAHNATVNTLSPGKNVYKEIKNWPHFDPDPELHVKELDDI